MPAEVQALVTDSAVAEGTHVFSVADTDVRRVVDALDDAGWRIVSVSAKRDSLEDYFARMLGGSADEGVAANG